MNDTHSTPMDDPREQRVLAAVPPQPTEFSIRHAKAETRRERQRNNLDATTGRPLSATYLGPISHEEGLRLEAQDILRKLRTLYGFEAVHRWLVNDAAAEGVALCERGQR